MHYLPRIGRRLRRAPAAVRRSAFLAARTQDGDRLLEAPVFILSSVRSGSTLLRVMLNSHSQLHAPHELHLSGIRVQFTSRHARMAMAELGLKQEQLELLLWDRMMHRELVHHGKKIFVEKTPSSARMWRKIKRGWPDARFIFLLRHPAAVVDSWARAQPRRPREDITSDVTKYMTAVDRARTRNDGITVRYEDVATDPERELRRICTYLGVEFEPAMLEYGSKTHGDFITGLGDWSSKIRSGRVQPPRPVPSTDGLPDELVTIARRWGYVD